MRAKGWLFLYGFLIFRNGLAVLLFSIFSFGALSTEPRHPLCANIVNSERSLLDIFPKGAAGESLREQTRKREFDGDHEQRVRVVLVDSAGKGRASRDLFVGFSRTVPVLPTGRDDWEVLEVSALPPSTSPIFFYLSLGQSGLYSKLKNLLPTFKSRNSKVKGEVIVQLEVDPVTLRVVRLGRAVESSFAESLSALSELEDWRQGAEQLSRWFSFDLAAFRQRQRVLQNLTALSPKNLEADSFQFVLPSTDVLVSRFHIEGASTRSQKQWQDLFATFLGPQLLMMAVASNPKAVLPMDLVLGRFIEFRTIREGSWAGIKDYVDRLESQYPIPGLRNAVLSYIRNTPLYGEKRLSKPIQELLAVWTLEIFLRLRGHVVSLENQGLIGSHEVISPRFPFKSAQEVIVLELGQEIPDGFEFFFHDTFLKGTIYIDQLALGGQLVQPNPVPGRLAEKSIKSYFHGYHDVAHLLGFCNPEYMRRVRGLTREIVINRPLAHLTSGRKNRHYYLIEAFFHPRKERLVSLLAKFQVDNLWDCPSLDCVDATLRSMSNHLEFVSQLWADRGNIVEPLGPLGIGLGSLNLKLQLDPAKPEKTPTDLTKYWPGPNFNAETAFGYRYPGTALIFFLVRIAHFSLEEHFDKFLQGDPEVLEAYQALFYQLPPSAQRLFHE